MIIETVRTETKRQHQELEGILIPVLKKMVDTKNYVELLTMFYGYYKGVEQATDKYLNDSIVPRYSARGKAERILEDLRRLGVNEVPAVSTNLPDINSPAAALGAMYVLEGSSLGGQIITRMLMKSMQLLLENFVFYNCYGEESKTYWDEYVNALNTYAASVDAEQQAVIVETAKETFSRFKEVAQQSLPKLVTEPV